MRATASDRTSRRRFLVSSAAAAGVCAFPLVVPSSVLCRAGQAAPSSRISIGCIGLGIQGMGNLRAFMGNTDTRIAAVCDVHQAQRQNGKDAVDKWYGSKDCAAYTDFRELIARPDIDAVQITTPDHWHPLIAIEAARHRRHIFCEKPIGWSLRAAQAVRQAVRDSGVVFQLGTQQRSSRRFRTACELVRSGRIGRLRTILVGVPAMPTCPKQAPEPVPPELDYEMWLGPAPMAPYCYQRCRPYTQKDGWSVWYSISDYCMGMIGNWGIHHLDIAQWGNGTDLSGPTEVEGRAVFPADHLTDVAVKWQVENRYANGVTLVHMDDATSAKHPLQPGGHGHGVMFLGDEGWIHVDRQRMDASPRSLLNATIGPGDVRLFQSDNHHVNFIDAINGRTKAAAPIDIAFCDDAICHLQDIATRLERRLRWDPARELFIDDDEANRMLDRPMRGPWRL
jgi:predicted dehydrogenase